MIKVKKIIRAIAIVNAFLLITSYSCAAAPVNVSKKPAINQSVVKLQVKQEETKQDEISLNQMEGQTGVEADSQLTALKILISKPIQPSNLNHGNQPKVDYKVVINKKGQPDSVIVYVNNKETVKFTEPAGGFSEQDRAKILVYRLKQFIEHKSNPNDITPGKEGNSVVIRAKDFVFLTVDDKSAKNFNMELPELALNWANKLRAALGASALKRDSSLIASRGFILPSFAYKTSGKHQLGTASWYGGRFIGRRTASGSRFNTYAFTAAHKTLPFGSTVKVTNMRNQKSCIVKITDRGPFIPGRIIDLSAAAAKEIGMFSSGISKVKVEIVEKL